MSRSPRVEIVYCTQCRWLLRAAWMAQELREGFPDIKELKQLVRDRIAPQKELGHSDHK
jgi:selenoprotein W-related protein